LAIACLVVPIAAAQEIKLTASDTSQGDQFGAAVSVDGQTAVVGAPGDGPAELNGAGSAYVFVRSGSRWTEAAKLVASDPSLNDTFGEAVAVSGDTVVIGAPQDNHAGGLDAGSAYVFVRNGGAWTEQAKLTASDASASDRFGWSVALAGDIVVIGVPLDDHAGGADAGSAYVFARSDGVWTEQAHLLTTDTAPNDRLGESVAVSGETAVLGAPGDDTPDGFDAGSAFVFVRSGALWTQQAKLRAADAAPSDVLGVSVAISGDTVLAGAYAEDNEGGLAAGSAYVFVRSGTAWTQQAKLMASDGTVFDLFGSAVALSGDRAVVGALEDDPAGLPKAGSMYVYHRSGTAWAGEVKLVASDAAAFDEFSESVAVSGETVLSGAWMDGHAGGSFAGSAYVYDMAGVPWTDLGSGLAGVAGVPRLEGHGTLLAGTQGAVELTSAAPSSLALLVLASGSTPTPFKCGTLVPVPMAVSLLLSTNASGTITGGWSSWPGGLSGLSLYFQYALQDAAAVCGVSLSNALRADVP